MKKFYYSLFAAATMLLATSCSQEEDFSQQSSGDLTTFSVSLDGETGSRAAGDGSKVTKLYYAVYDKNTSAVIFPSTVNSGVKYKDANKQEGKWTVELPLMKSETYDIIFWAQVDGSTYYEFTELTDIKVKYDNALSNIEDRDAFFNALDDFTASGSKHTIVLRRPFAQLNVATTLNDWTDAQNITGGTNPVTASAVKVSSLATNFNAMTGAATNPTTVEFKANNLIDETISITLAGETEPTEYKLLAMNYLLPEGEKTPNGLGNYSAAELNTDKDVVEVEFTLYKGQSEQIVNVKVPSTPIQRNYRTNIIGDLLTGEYFDIIVDAEFDKDENQEITISAEGIVKDAEGIYHITKAEGLWALANLVNNGSQDAVPGARAAAVGYDFKGETFVLDCDVDLEGKEWTPMDGFNGTFDGKENTIKNFTAEAAVSAGLFGNLGINAVVKNLKVENATIIGNHYAGVIAGYGYATIDNCDVKNSSVTLTTEIINGTHDNGDKAGAIIGYLCEEMGKTEDIGTDYVKNCTADQVTIRGYRDIGGLVGYANGTATVSNNSVTNSIIIIDKTNNYKNYTTDEPFHGGAVVGKEGEKATVKENTATDVEIKYIGGVDYAGYYQDVNGNYIVTEGRGIGNAVANGATSVTVIAAIEATEIDAEGKTVTIKGEGENASIDFTGTTSKIECKGNLKFEDLTIKMNCSNYAQTGLNNNGSKHEYINCNFYGTATVWGECTYTDCTFTATTDGQYAAFAQSFNDVTYTRCTFTASNRTAKICPIKRNNEPSTATLNVTYNDCTFNAEKDQYKAAVEIDNNGFIVNVTFNGETTLGGYIKENDYFASEGKGTTNVTFNGHYLAVNTSQFAAAFENKDIEAILLAPGTYDVSVYSEGKKIIESLDVNNKALVKGQLVVRGETSFKNINFEVSENTSKEINISTYGSYTNRYRGIVNLSNSPVSFEGCQFVGNATYTNAINYFQSDDANDLLTIKDCVFKNAIIYTRLRADIQNCNFYNDPVHFKAPYFICAYQTDGGKMTVKEVDVDNETDYLLIFLSNPNTTTDLYRNLSFDLQNNEKFKFTYAYVNKTGVKFATDGSITFEEGSATFELDSNGNIQ